MSREHVIQKKHLSKLAVVYVRQSTAKQVAHNQESTRRQYQLSDKARVLGWPEPRVQIIDDDLGLSGASSECRTGFQRLVSTVGMGEVGIPKAPRPVSHPFEGWSRGWTFGILVTEVSRLSRLNSDWHRVIELCAVFETLIADEDGLYDPRDPNDRLVLGLKGTLFSAELQILQARMRGGLLNKARRGAHPLAPPKGHFRRGVPGCALAGWISPSRRWLGHT